MELKTYIAAKGSTCKLSCPILAKLARSYKCSAGTLYLIVSGNRVPSVKLAGRIELASKGAVTRQELRPDVFGPITSRK